MNDKFEDFHKQNKKAEEHLKRLNDQKSRTFFFNKNGKSPIPSTPKPIHNRRNINLERESQIEKDNANLLSKLEEIKKKGTNHVVGSVSLNFAA